MQGLAKIKAAPVAPVQFIFRVLRDPYFISKSLQISSPFTSSECLRLLQVSIYLFAKGALRYFLPSLQDIRLCVTSVSRSMSDGIPLKAEVIRPLLKDMNKYIPNAVLELWVEKTAPYLREMDVIAPHECLFLVANCRNRTEAVQSLPYKQVTVTPEVSGMYALDEVVNHPSHPDSLLESLATKGLVLDHITFIGNTDLRLSEPHSKPTPDDIEILDIDHFRRELNRDSQKNLIKQTIENCRQRLNAAKLGGRLAFEERHFKGKRMDTQPGKFAAPCVTSTSFTQSRLSFFSNTAYNTYIPPNILFPPKPRFRKGKCGKKLVNSPSLSYFLSKRPTTASIGYRTVDTTVESKRVDAMNVSVYTVKSDHHSLPFRPKLKSKQGLERRNHSMCS